MSVPVENWGQLKVNATVTKEGSSDTDIGSVALLSLPKSKERSSPHFASQSLITLPIRSIVNATGTTKNDITLTLQPHSSTTTVSGGQMELTSVRFAVPNSCVGYEETEEAGREILGEIQEAIKAYHAQMIGSSADETGVLRLATLATGKQHKDERVICVFDDILLSYPAGKYKLIVSNYNIVIEDKKRSSVSVISIPLSDVDHMYLCDVPNYFSKTSVGDDQEEAQYLVLILKSPLKIRSTNYAHVVISCPAGLALDDEHAWKCELTTQEEINKALHFKPEDGECPLQPTMSGKVGESILLPALKSIAKVPAYGGLNKQYRTVLTQNRHSCMRALYRSAEGLLYVVNGGLLFLHRPALKMPFSDITRIEIDEAGSGVATFQISVFVGSEKHVLSGIDKAEKSGLLDYLDKVTKVVRLGIENDEEDNEEEEEEDDEESDYDAEEDDDDDGEASEDESDDGDSKKKSSKHKHHKRSRDHKHHKHHKHHHKEKKHKTE